MDIRFGDHSSFQRAAAGMTCGALVFGLGLHALTPMAPLAGGLLGIAAGAGLAYRRAPWRMGAAAAALLLLVLSPPSWQTLAGAASVLSIAVALGGARGVRGLVSVLAGAITVLIAMWCALRIGNAQQTASWPPLVTTGVSAMAMGAVGALATLPRHLTIRFDPVQAAVKRLPASLDPDVRSLCGRAVAIWTTAKLHAGDDAGASLVRDGVLRTLDVALNSARVVPTGASETELASRMLDLDQRITAATDPEVKAQYQAARGALDDQQRYRSHIRRNRERLVARMHNHVAALEKFELAATSLEASRAAGSPVTSQLEALSHDVAASGDALGDLELG